MSATLAATVFVSLVMLVLGSAWLIRGGTETLIAAGVVTLVLSVAVGVIGLSLDYAAERRQAELQDRLAELQRKLGEGVSLLRKVREQTMLSDSAKAILYRKEERTLIQNAIDEETTRENWDEAIVLVEEMMHRFGASAALAEMRANIDAARVVSAERALDAQIETLEEMLDRQAWQEAGDEALRICQAFPDSPRARQLAERVQEAHREHKLGVVESFREAAGHGDYDRAMQLLKQLDQHLSEEEAAPLAEIAREVIANFREVQGERFRGAVQRHDWSTAVHLGEQIIEQFPNAKMAEEVAEMMDGLRSRAAGHSSQPMPAAGEAPAEGRE
ncbi:MAG: hypothetical protein ACF8NJ_00950 [Phycisphaerales bacterium JB038]